MSKFYTSLWGRPKTKKMRHFIIIQPEVKTTFDQTTNTWTNNYSYSWAFYSRDTKEQALGEFVQEMKEKAPLPKDTKRFDLDIHEVFPK